MSSNVSYDLIWQVASPYSTYLVKRRNAGVAYFSNEPLNVTGKYTQKGSGFANASAVGVVPTPKGIQLIQKSAKNANFPKKVSTSTFHPHRDSRKIARAVSKNTVNHREEILEPAIYKASALARGRYSRKTYAAKSRK